MVVNDPPTALRFSEQQSKCSMRLVIHSLQTPTAQNQSRIFAEHRDFEIGKCEHAHLVARVVVSFVTVENGLPATTNVVATYKFSIRASDRTRPCSLRYRRGSKPRLGLEVPCGLIARLRSSEAREPGDDD